MPSIYQQQLGPEFAKLHPRIQERLAFASNDNRAFVGEGTMEQVWHGPFYTQPFLRIGLLRNSMFPEAGRQVPFRIENYAYRDPLGRETVTWIRRFTFPRHVRCFDATMIRSAARGRIVDYLGTPGRRYRPGRDRARWPAPALGRAALLRGPAGV